MKRSLPFLFYVLVILCLLPCIGRSQAELEAWGNLRGIRIEGELMRFESGIGVQQNGSDHFIFTGKEKQSPVYSRESGSQIVRTQIDRLRITETVSNPASGNARIVVEGQLPQDTASLAAYFSIVLEETDYASGTIQLDQLKPVLLSSLTLEEKKNQMLNGKTRIIQFETKTRRFVLTMDSPMVYILKKGK